MVSDKNIIISGGTGLIGSNLVEKLIAGENSIHILTRNAARYTPTTRVKYVDWDPIKGQLNMEELPDPDVIINLAGAPIVGKRWTDGYKKLIIDSRVKSAELLDKYIEAKGNKLELYLGASAIGIYGNAGHKEIDESHQGDAQRFIVHSVLEWEKAHQKVVDRDIRSVILRIGLVMSPEGGMLEKMLLPSKFRLYSYFGDGQQYQSWIHIDDMTDMMIFAIENPQMAGVFNGVAPNPVTAKVLTQTLGRTIGPGLTMPAPKFVLKLAMGEMSKLLFDSVRASSQRVEDNGYKFRFTSIDDAMKDLLS